MGLRSYIIKRIIYSIALIIIVICLNFTIFFLMPGDPYGAFLPARSNTRPEVLENIRKFWGFYDPPYVKLAKYIVNLMSWNFGVSIRNLGSVSEQMAGRIPYTLILLGSSTILAIIFGLFLGVYVAHRRGGMFDTANVSFSLVVGSLPTFWMGLVFLFIFSTSLHWFPPGLAMPPQWAINGPGFKGFPVPLTIGTTSFPNVTFAFNPSDIVEFIRGYGIHAFLPVLVLTLFQYGGHLLLTRAVMVEALTEDYIVTARAKGVTEREVLFKHALKNASLPIITNIALSFGFILSGAIITETVFSWPGLGTWIWDAIQTSNYPVLMASFYVIALCAIIAILLADLIYGVVDPRIHYG
jgi:peptide/nickel transport system permease protein